VQIQAALFDNLALMLLYSTPVFVPSNWHTKESVMGYNTENVLALAPGLILGALDGGGMVLDRDSGDFVPAEQVIHDPLHIDKLDLLDQDNLGFLKADIVDDGIDEYDDGDDLAEIVGYAHTEERRAHMSHEERDRTRYVHGSKKHGDR
jgi:hypothetical protein